MSENIKLEMCHVSKWFPGVKALNDVSFQVKEGTVKALCGENGAGKSTLMKILDGIYHPDEGEIYIEGKKVEIPDPIRARKLGIAMIFQELSYVPDMTIAENIYLGNWPMKRKGKIDWPAIKKDTIELLEKEEFPYSYDTKLRELSISDIQLIEILKAISYDANIIIMDEPTSSLTDKESEKLFEKIKKLKEKGVSIIYISHKLEEVFRIADEITILRDGTTIDTKPIDQIDSNKVIELMVGRKIENLYPKAKVEIGNILLRVENLTREGVFKDISFDLNEGEIVGLAGLVGSGRTEIVRALYGLDPLDSGKVWIKDKEIKVKSVKQSINNGTVMVSEDRRRYGIIPMRSVTENVSIASLEKFIYHGWLHKKKEIDTVRDICQKMNVKTPDLETTVSTLSGGNQQKLILAKWMVRDPEVLIVDEPTRGIDVGAKKEIFQLMGALVKQKKGILMISSEMMELISICDRIYVISEGRITGMLHREEFSQKKIMQLAVDKKGVI